MYKRAALAVSTGVRRGRDTPAVKGARVIAMSARSESTASEAELYRAIVENHVGWQRQIFDQYVSLVRGLMIKTLGPRDDIEDLVADVFVGLFESAPNIRSAEGLRSYVVSVALNTARREIKRRKRRRLVFWQEASEDEVERVPGTDDPRAKAALRQLSRFLDELTTEERFVYVLHVLEGNPLSDVAETLKLSRSTVKRRLKKANEKMLRRVEKNPLLTEYVRNKGAGSDD
jgi:RNA polymerase sigma factor (sigma-70 family)